MSDIKNCHCNQIFKQHIQTEATIVPQIIKTEKREKCPVHDYTREAIRHVFSLC